MTLDEVGFAFRSDEESVPGSFWFALAAPFSQLRCSSSRCCVGPPRFFAHLMFHSQWTADFWKISCIVGLSLGFFDLCFAFLFPELLVLLLGLFSFFGVLPSTGFF